MPKIEAATVAEHHALRRAAILEAAVTILGAEGPAALTPAAVAAAAGLARSSVYQYYPSTGALVGAGVEETFHRVLARIETGLSAASSPQEQVAAYVDSALDAAAAGHEPMRLYAAADLPDDCRAAVVDLHRRVTMPLVSALEAHGVDDARGVAELVGGVVSAAAAQVARGERVDEVRARVQRFVAGALMSAEAV